MRFIAISNNVDSALNDGSNEFVPFLNITNEWYVRDTSRKIKSVLHNKGMDGKTLDQQRNLLKMRGDGVKQSVAHMPDR